MKKKPAAILFIIFCVSSALAQTTNVQTNKCSLTAEQLPAIRGLRIGMSVEQVLVLFPGSSNEPAIKEALANAERAPNYGLVGLNFYPEKYSSPPQFSGVRDVGVNFFDGRVFHFVVTYAGVPGKSPWANVDQFLEKVISAYKLPGVNNWMRLNDGGQRVLDCPGGQITVSTENSCCPSIRVQGPDPRPQVKARYDAEMKKLRDALVP